MFRIAFAFTLLATTVAALLGATQAAVIIFAVIGITAMVLTRLQDIVSIKVFGLEAQLQSKIDEANVTIKQLQELALAVSQPVITNLAIQGHFVQLKYSERYNMRDSINKLLVDIGVEESAVSNVNSAFDQMFRGLLIARITGDVTDEEENSSGRAERLRNITSVPSFSEVESFLREFDLLTDKRNEYLEELRFLESNGVLRNPAILDK